MAEENEEKKQFGVFESHGIYKGVLVEDMAYTVQRTGQQFINVLIEELWEEDQPYPYTWVGGWHNLPNLLKGDEVLIQFTQNNYLYPILYKYEGVPENLYTIPEMPEAGDIVEFPEIEPSEEQDDGKEAIEGVYAIGRNGFVCETTKHVIFKYQDEMLIWEQEKGCWFQCTGEFNIKTQTAEMKMGEKDIDFKLEEKFHALASDSELTMEEKKTNIVATEEFKTTVDKSELTMKKDQSSLVTQNWELTMANKIKFGKTDTLGKMVTDLITYFINLCQKLETLTTIGSPTTQSINPAISTAIASIDMQANTLKTKWGNVFE